MFSIPEYDWSGKGAERANNPMGENLGVSKQFIIR